MELVKVAHILGCVKDLIEDQEEETGSHSLTPGAGSWICSAVTDNSQVFFLDGLESTPSVLWIPAVGPLNYTTKCGIFQAV